MKKIIKNILLLFASIMLIIACEKEVSRSNPITPKPTGGTLFISSTPSGAKIYLDGKNTGLVTPDSLTWLEVKKYDVILKKELYLDTTFQVVVKENVTRKIDINFNLNPKMWGSITCQTTPDQARVILNGKDTGKRTSTTIDSLLPGKYIVKYIAENARADSSVITVSSGQNSLSLVVLLDTTYWVDYNQHTSNIPNYTYKKIIIDNNDNIWLGSLQNGLTKFDGNTWTNFNIENSGLVSNNIIEMKLGPNKHLWVCTQSGLCEYDGIIWKSYKMSDGTGLPSNLINDITFDIDGNPIVATDKGLAKYMNNSWEVFKFKLEFPSSFPENYGSNQNYFTSIDVDVNGNWWATRIRNGIAYWNGNNWFNYFTYPDEEGLDNNIYYSIVRHAGNEIWFGHRINSINGATVGLSSYINNQFDKFSYSEFFSVDINSIRIKSNMEKWIATSQGLFSFVNYSAIQKYSKQNTPLATNDIQDVAFDSKGNVWVVTAFYGIYKYKIGQE